MITHDQSVRVGMIIIQVQDIEKSVEFYSQLGLSLKFCVPGKWAEFQAGSIKIELCHTNQPLAGQHKTGVVFHVDDIQALYEKSHTSIQYLYAPVSAPHGIMARVIDPSGNLLDLYQPTPVAFEQHVKNQCCKKDMSLQQAAHTPAPEVGCCKKQQSCC